MSNNVISIILLYLSVHPQSVWPEKFCPSDTYSWCPLCHKTCLPFSEVTILRFVKGKMKITGAKDSIPG